MTKRGMKTGAKLPSNYDEGDGAINCFYAILVKAEKDNAQMFKDYQETEWYKKTELCRSKGLRVNVDKETIEAVAWWVASYLTGTPKVVKDEELDKVS